MHSVGTQITQERRKGGAGALNKGLYICSNQKGALYTMSPVSKVAIQNISYGVSAVHSIGSIEGSVA